MTNPADLPDHPIPVQSQQEQGGYAVPECRVAVCDPGGGKINGGAVVPAFARIGIGKHLRGLEVQL